MGWLSSDSLLLFVLWVAYCHGRVPSGITKLAVQNLPITGSPTEVVQEIITLINKQGCSQASVFFVTCKTCFKNKRLIPCMICPLKQEVP